jgi:hypothetical protein
MRGLLCGLLLAASLPVTAAVYTYVDTDGNRVFTDQPRPGARRLQLDPRGAAPASARSPQAPAPVAARYDMLRVLIPEPDATLPPSESGLIVTVTSDPGLRPGHAYLLFLDGQAVGRPGRSPVFPLPALSPGIHRLAVAILDANGRVLERTPSQPLRIAAP